MSKLNKYLSRFGYLDLRANYGNQKAKDFNGISYLISSCFSFLINLEKYNVENIVITLYPDLSVYRKYGDEKIIGLDLGFDFDVFWKKSKRDQRLLLLELLKKNIEDIIRKREGFFDIENYNNLITQISNENFLLEGYFSNIIRHKESIARLRYKNGEKSFIIYCDFFNNKLEVTQSILILETWFHAYFLQRLSGKHKWINDEQLLIVPEDDIEKYKIIINSNSYRITSEGQIPEWISFNNK